MEPNGFGPGFLHGGKVPHFPRTTRSLPHSYPLDWTAVVWHFRYHGVVYSRENENESPIETIDTHTHGRCRDG